jgi:hypothetical protein
MVSRIFAVEIRWSQGTGCFFGPHGRESSHLQKQSSPESNVFEIHNRSGDNQTYVLQNLENETFKWLYGKIARNHQHNVTAGAVKFYYIVG